MKSSSSRKPRYRERDTRRWLHAIARGMKQTGRSTLFIEQLQPGVFLRRREKIAYVFLTRCLAGIIFGVAAGAIHHGLSLNIKAFTYGMPACWGFGAGFATAVAATLRLASRTVNRIPIKSAIAIDVVRASLVTSVAALGIFIAHAAFIAWSVDFDTASEIQNAANSKSLTLGDLFLADVRDRRNAVSKPAVIERLVLMGFVALLNGVMGLQSMGRAFTGDIESVETLGFSAKDSVTGYIAGGVVSFMLSLAYIAIIANVVGDHPRASESPDPLIEQFPLLTLPALCRSVAITVVGIVIGGTFHGWKPQVREQKLIPNHGIVLSVRYCLQFGLSLGVFAGVFWGACIGTTELQVKLSRTSPAIETPIAPTPDIERPNVESDTGVVDNSEVESVERKASDDVSRATANGDRGLASEGLPAGLFGGFGVFLVAGFWFGGLDVMRHYSLRFLLGVFGYVPMRLVPFLDYVETELSFIVRNGGGYRFMHRYLLEYFAEHPPVENNESVEHHSMSVEAL